MVRYDRPRGVNPGCKPGCVQVQAYVIGANPPASNVGCYNPTHGTDSGSFGLHQEGRAIDVGIPGTSRGPNRAVGDKIFAWAVANVDVLQIQEVIWNHQIWSASRPYIHRYDANPHEDHVHIGFNWTGALARYATLPPFGTPVPKPPVPPAYRPPEDQMFTIWYLGYPHTFWIGAQGQLLHDFGEATPENMNAKYRVNEIFDPVRGITAIIDQRTLGLHVRLVSVQGRLIRWSHSTVQGWGVSAVG